MFVNAYLTTVCKKASQKLNALSRLCSIIPLPQRRCLMEAFFASQFSYSPLVWMFHSRTLNRKINNLHYRALRIVYRDETASFDELLAKDGSCWMKPYIDLNIENVTRMVKIYLSCFWENYGESLQTD